MSIRNEDGLSYDREMEIGREEAARFYPKSGVNLVGDDTMNDPGHQLYLIEHYATEDEAIIARAAYMKSPKWNRMDNIRIFYAPGDSPSPRKLPTKSWEEAEREGEAKDDEDAGGVGRVDGTASDHLDAETFAGVFLDPPSQEKLRAWWKEKVGTPLHENAGAHHMTIKFAPSDHDVAALPIGSTTTLRVTGHASDERGQAVTVSSEVPSASPVPHITMATARGVAPVYSNELLSKGHTSVSDGPVLTGTVENRARVAGGSSGQHRDDHGRFDHNANHDEHGRFATGSSAGIADRGKFFSHNAAENLSNALWSVEARPDKSDDWDVFSSNDRLEILDNFKSVVEKAGLKVTQPAEELKIGQLPAALGMFNPAHAGEPGRITIRPEQHAAALDALRVLSDAPPESKTQLSATQLSGLKTYVHEMGHTCSPMDLLHGYQGYGAVIEEVTNETVARDIVTKMVPNVGDRLSLHTEEAASYAHAIAVTTKHIAGAAKLAGGREMTTEKAEAILQKASLAYRKIQTKKPFGREAASLEFAKIVAKVAVQSDKKISATKMQNQFRTRMERLDQHTLERTDAMIRYNTVWELPRNNIEAALDFIDQHPSPSPDDMAVILQLQDNPAELLKAIETSGKRFDYNPNHGEHGLFASVGKFFGFGGGDGPADRGPGPEKASKAEAVAPRQPGLTSQDIMAAPTPRAHFKALAEAAKAIHPTAGQPLPPGKMSGGVTYARTVQRDDNNVSPREHEPFATPERRALLGAFKQIVEDASGVKQKLPVGELAIRDLNSARGMFEAAHLEKVSEAEKWAHPGQYGDVAERTAPGRILISPETHLSAIDGLRALGDGRKPSEAQLAGIHSYVHETCHSTSPMNINGQHPNCGYHGSGVLVEEVTTEVLARGVMSKMLAEERTGMPISSAHSQITEPRAGSRSSYQDEINLTLAKINNAVGDVGKAQTVNSIGILRDATHAYRSLTPPVAFNKDQACRAFAKCVADAAMKHHPEIAPHIAEVEDTVRFDAKTVYDLTRNDLEAALAFPNPTPDEMAILLQLQDDPYALLEAFKARGERHDANPNHDEHGRFAAGSLYHVTYAQHLASIAENGLVPSGGTGIGENANLGLHSQGKVFLTDKKGVDFWRRRLEDHANDRSDDPLTDHLTPVTLRVNKDLEDVEHDEPGSRDSRATTVMTHEGIAPEHLEFHYQGKWHPISEHEKIDEQSAYTTEKDPDGGRDLHWHKEDYENPLAGNLDAHAIHCDMGEDCMCLRVDYNSNHDEHGRFTAGMSSAAMKVLARSNEARAEVQEAKEKLAQVNAKLASKENVNDLLNQTVLRLYNNDPSLKELQNERTQSFRAQERAEAEKASTRTAVEACAVPLADNIRGNTSPGSSRWPLAGKVMSLATSTGDREAHDELFKALRENAPLSPDDAVARWKDQVDKLESAHVAQMKADDAYRSAGDKLQAVNDTIHDHPLSKALDLAANPIKALKSDLSKMPEQVRDLLVHEGERQSLVRDAHELKETIENRTREADDMLARSKGSGIDLLEPTHSLDVFGREPSIDSQQYTDQQDAQKKEIVERMGYETAQNAFDAGDRYTASFEHARLIRQVQAGVATKEMIAADLDPHIVRQDARFLDKLTKSELPETLTVFRGIRMSREAADKLIEQKAISFNSVASSSLLLHEAMGYVDYHKDEAGFEQKKTGVVLEMKTNRGYYASETMAEITLPKDSYYAIKSVTRDIASGYVHIVAEDTHVGE